MINLCCRGLTLVTPRLQWWSPALGMQPHNLALQPFSRITHSPVFQQHLFCYPRHSLVFWSFLPSPSHNRCACENVYECMCAAEICSGGREMEGKKAKHVYSFPLGSFKKVFQLQSNLHLIKREWPPAYIILHSRSAYMTQREVLLFYSWSDNLSPLFSGSCNSLSLAASFFQVISFTEGLLQTKL